MKRRFVVANWKMNPETLNKARALWGGVREGLPELHTAHVIVCPPTPYLAAFVEDNTSTGILLPGVQDCSVESGTGAFTGEVSASMLQKMGARYVILGHSERRARGETDSVVATKISRALESGLVPVVCIGETSREDPNYRDTIIAQLESIIGAISDRTDFPVMIAYEPIWAISSNEGRPATPKECEEAIEFIRSALSRNLGPRGDRAEVLYGGSVSPEDIESYVLHGGSDGFLVGRASLSSESFIPIIETVERS
jgi:triosephosphate isomerase (TIM)